MNERKGEKKQGVSNCSFLCSNTNVVCRKERKTGFVQRGCSIEIFFRIEEEEKVCENATGSITAHIYNIL